MSVEGGKTALPDVLARLKRNGSGLLVVGAADAQRALCNRLQGSAARHRERIVVDTTGDHGHCCTARRSDATARVEI